MKITRNFRNQGWIKFNLSIDEMYSFMIADYKFDRATNIKEIELFWKIFKKYKNKNYWNILEEGGALKNFSKKAIACCEEKMLA